MGSSELVTEAVDQGTWRVLSIQGEIDMATARHVESAVADQVAGGARSLVVDMRAVTFIDSTGITVLFRAHQQIATSGGVLRVLCAPGPVRRVLDVSGIAEVVPMFDDHDQAVAG